MFPRRSMPGQAIESRFGAGNPSQEPEAVLEHGKVELRNGRRYRWHDLGTKPAAHLVSEEFQRRNRGKWD